MTEKTDGLDLALEDRFGVRPERPAELNDKARAELEMMASRRCHRSWTERAVSAELVELLVACALSAPSKSDLQQVDIIDVRDQESRDAIAELIPSMPWIASAPVFLVVCGNNRRLRMIAEAQGHPFANDHLDAFFNAAVDAGIHLAYLVQAVETYGLGCCPVSVIRNHGPRISELLALPDWVFPVAGLAVGWPDQEGKISPRLPLDVTFHRDRYSETADLEAIRAYDQRRRDLQPFKRQRRTDLFGEIEGYGWMEEKARQYAQPERTDFGSFIRSKGFKLD